MPRGWRRRARGGILDEVSTYAIRRASVNDLDVLRELGRRTFTQTFGHLYALTDLAAFLEDAYSREKFGARLADERTAFWLLERDQEPIGFAEAGPCHLPHPDVREGDGELRKLYVLASHRGGGRGRMLLETALEWLPTANPGTQWLGVWSENFGAQRLYTSYGFARAGEYYFKVGDHRDFEFIFRRENQANP